MLEHYEGCFVYPRNSFLDQTIQGVIMARQWADGKTRCTWANPNNPRCITYHDDEWGVPTYDDHDLLEMLILECFQAGLSWECVLNKRAAFRGAFDNFDLDKLCSYNQVKINSLMQEERIIRNRRKIDAAIINARAFRLIRAEFGDFASYIWGWTDGVVVREADPAFSPMPDTISKDLKARGMKFVGPTVVHAFLQSIGIIYAHEEGCYLHAKNDRGERMGIHRSSTERKRGE